MVMFCTVAETLKDLILESRKRYLVTNRKIANALGVDDQTVSNFIAGRTKRPHAFRQWEKLADVLRIEPERLRASVEYTFGELPKLEDESDPGTDGNIQPLHDIPQWDLEIAAGDWCESCINGTIDTNDAAQIRSMNQGLFRVKIRGDSMLPRFKEGEILEFKVFRHGEADDEGIRIGKPYYVHRSDGTCTFKILESMDEETAVLRALNKRKYPKGLVVPVQEIVRMARFVGKYVPDEE